MASLSWLRLSILSTAIQIFFMVQFSSAFPSSTLSPMALWSTSLSSSESTCTKIFSMMKWTPVMQQQQLQRRGLILSSTTRTALDLEKKTVQELKQILKDNNLLERGLLSRLTRKQALVEYLKEHLSSGDIERVDNHLPDMEDSMPSRSSASWRSDEEHNSPPLAVANKMKGNDKESDMGDDDFKDFPLPLREKLARRGISSLLPIQAASYNSISSGKDAVVHSPTGTGKTWAFCLPLAARILTDKLLQPQAKGKHSSERNVAVSPRILTLVPSRELARQVGKEWSKWTDAPVATVFGGVPLERHTNLLRKGGGAHVVVSTPGRWRELVREGHADYQHIHVVVLDEADTMLDASDSPDVTAILDQITTAVGDRENIRDQEYQMILVSATINSLVRSFALDVMEVLPKSFITAKRPSAQEVKHQNTSESHDVTSVTSRPTLTEASTAAPAVQHWYTPVKTFVQPSVTSDLIMSLMPRVCIIFVPTKSDTETISTFLSQKLVGGGSSSIQIRTLHGDMTQAQRSRTISLLRDGHQNQVLVATDVASRGLDLPNVDLVVQFGIPRIAGKQGTYNVDLYTHRTGRAGRVGNHGGISGGDFNSGLLTLSTAANAVLLYDPAEGEGKLLDDLMSDVKRELGVTLRHRPIPSSRHLVDAAYDHAANRCFRNSNGAGAAVETDPDLVAYFRNRLEHEDTIDMSDTENLIHHLCTSMAMLANLDPAISPTQQHCSVLTGDPNDRTLKIYRDDGTTPVSPPEVTKFVRAFGSGKIGRVIVVDEGQYALLDLPVGRAKRLLDNLAAAATATTPNETNGWRAEMTMSVPEHYMITGRSRS